MYLFRIALSMSRTYVINSWYYNPIHPWHIDCMELSKALWDELRLIVNNDKQAEDKRWVPSFQDEQFRMRVAWSVRYVDEVFLCVDQDQSVCESIRKVYSLIKKRDPEAKVIFAKWWDRFAYEIPETKLCKELGIEVVDSVWKKTHHSKDYVVLD